MKPRCTTAWAGLTAAALVTTSACGAEGTRRAAEAVNNADTIMAALSRATDRTERLGSAEVRMPTDLGTGAPVTMDGTYSWGGGYAFDVEMEPRAPRRRSSRPPRSAPCSSTAPTPTTWTRSPPARSRQGVDEDRRLGDLRRAGRERLSGSAGSPSASMKGLKYASDVEDLGEETVNGKATTHYRAVLDTEDMGKFQKAYGGEDTLFNSLTGGADEVTMEIWVGAKDLPVRMVQEFGALEVTMDFDRLDATRKIQARPPTRPATSPKR